MKKILCPIFFIAFSFSVQVTFGETITIGPVPMTRLPIKTAEPPNKWQMISLGYFDYQGLLPEGGEVTSAWINTQFKGKHINKIRKLELHLDDIEILDFGQSVKGKIKKRLAHGKWTSFRIDIEQDNLLDALADGEATLSLYGKPKFFRTLRLGDTELTVIDPPADDPGAIFISGSNLEGFGGPFAPNGISPVPEPSSMLLLGSGLIGLAGYGRRKFFKK